MRKLDYLLLAIIAVLVINAIMQNTDQSFIGAVTSRASKYQLALYDADVETEHATFAAYDSSTTKFKQTSNEWEIEVYDDGGNLVFEIALAGSLLVGNGSEYIRGYVESTKGDSLGIIYYNDTGATIDTAWAD